MLGTVSTFAVMLRIRCSAMRRVTMTTFANPVNPKPGDRRAHRRPFGRDFAALDFRLRRCSMRNRIASSPSTQAGINRLKSANAPLKITR
jgi:hypothetical protein